MHDREPFRLGLFPTLQVGVVRCLLLLLLIILLFLLLLLLHHHYHHHHSKLVVQTFGATSPVPYHVGKDDSDSSSSESGESRVPRP